MNKQKFEKELAESVIGHSVNIKFLSSWYDKVIDYLGVLAKQKSQISHPRYRGDSREIDIKKFINDVIPKSIITSNGFVMNPHTGTSYEQDFMFLDSRLASSLVNDCSTSYYPVKSILASMEIKSKLTLSEIRKTILNCVSLKKLNGLDPSERDNDLAYFVFAYASSWDLKTSADKFNNELANVPPDLRPNMIYILQEGFLLPSLDGAFSLGPEQLFVEAPLKSQGAIQIMKAEPPSQAIPFLWFLSNLIDHCTKKLFTNDFESIGDYVFAPVIWQHEIEKKLAQPKSND